ncbi:MFS transporter, partial [Salmonella enterica]
AFPSLISPLKVKKQPLEIFTIAPSIAAEAPEIKQVLDFDFDKEEKLLTSPPPPIKQEIDTAASEKSQVSTKPEKIIQIPDPQEEEWAFNSQPEPEEEKNSLLDF